jgi:hypothetical protein
MKRWMYSRLEINFGDDEHFSMSFFTPEGVKGKRIKGDRKDSHWEEYERQIALLGLDGWEMVSAAPYKGWNAQYRTSRWHLWFKRPLEDS